MTILRTLAAAAAMAALAGAAPAQERLRAVTFIPSNHPVLVQANAWAEKVNEEMGDALQIEIVGGPEVIGRFQQPDAVINGIIDIAILPANDYQDRLPLSPAFALSQLTPAEERESGFYDFMVEKHEDMGVRYLGRMQRAPFYLWTKTEPRSLDDLAGLKMRTGVLYDRMMQEFGMVPVTINSPEVYTALQSGVVDGFGWPVAGPRNQGWLEEVKNVVDLPFFGASNVVALMNLDAFEGLPPEAQDRLIEITAEFEPEMTEFFAAQDEAEWAEIGDSVNKITFSEDENARYLDTAYEVEWDALAENAPAEDVQRLRELSGN